MQLASMAAFAGAPLMGPHCASLAAFNAHRPRLQRKANRFQALCKARTPQRFDRSLGAADREMPDYPSAGEISDKISVRI
jgi:hypothetical protein